MLINNLDDEKGFENFDWVKANRNGIVFHKDTKFLKKHVSENLNQRPTGVILSGLSQPTHVVSEQVYNNATESVRYDFDNEEKKVWISVSLAFSHFFLDTLGSILVLNNTYPGILFIIDFVGGKDRKHDVYLELLQDFLIVNNINSVVIEDPYAIKINNFYEIISLTISDFIINEIYKFSNKYIIQDSKQSKQVYLSRRFTPCHRNTDAFKSIGIDIKKIGYSDIRIYNEEVIEHFFRSNGFEIVYPEKFSSIKEQINFFNDVRVLVSPTSSGLMNAMFMQPEGVVVEFMTPFIPGLNDRYELHSSQYVEICYAKKHSYLGIPSKFYSNKIIDYISKNQHIYNFIINNNLVNNIKDNW